MFHLPLWITILGLCGTCLTQSAPEPPNFPGPPPDNGLGEILSEAKFDSEDVDVVVFLSDSITNLEGFPEVEEALTQYHGLDPLIAKTMQVIPFPSHPCKRMIYVPTGNLNVDMSDSRQIYENAMEAAKMVWSMRWRKPLFVLGPLHTAKGEEASWLQGDFPKMQMALGALQGFYMPMILRESPIFTPKKKFDELRFYKFSERLVEIAKAIEIGRILNRDTCAADPERMPPPAIETYYKASFKDPASVKTEYIENMETYPMIKAVARAVNDVPQYKPRVIKMSYVGDKFNEKEDPTLLLVGKGITYDTGGTRLKTGGVMVFMRKDKCGATSVAGFFKVLELLKPTKIQVKGYMAFVRNGIGAKAYVHDEIIKLRSNLRVLIQNTDAEGRNVMVDMIADAVDEYKQNKWGKPHIFTIATLTGAVGRAFQKFTAMMDNKLARVEEMTKRMTKAGMNLADLVEPSTIRREEYDVQRPYSDVADILQSNDRPNTGIFRGYQLPSGFLATAGGIDLWGYNTIKLPYTHLDVSAAVGVKYREATATPTTMFVSEFILPRIDGFNFGTKPTK